MKKRTTILIAMITVGIVSFKIPSSQQLEIPKTHPSELIISHLGYTLSFNHQHKQANWVAYELTDKETLSTNERTNKFIPDDQLKTGAATNEDYTGSGYDRGHLAPAGDMGWSEQAMKESFYFTNISPQVTNFNRGIWKKCEELVRLWAIENKSLYIITGPILTDNLPSIGINKISVPNYFFKAILDYTTPSIKGIAFLIPNQASSKPLQQYVISIDSLENYSTMDFFYQLPDSIESEIEKSTKITDWSWKPSVSPSNEPTKKTVRNEAKKQSTICRGKTKKGNRCQNKTTTKNGFCESHKNQAKQN